VSIGEKTMEQLKIALLRPSERRVPVVVEAPGAREVILTGDFTGWSREGVRLRRSAAGQWGIVLKLAPGEYAYRLLIDGEWSDHSTAVKRVPNGHGSFNCILAVPER